MFNLANGVSLKKYLISLLLDDVAAATVVLLVMHEERRWNWSNKSDNDDNEVCKKSKKVLFVKKIKGACMYDGICVNRMFKSELISLHFKFVSKCNARELKMRQKLSLFLVCFFSMINELFSSTFLVVIFAIVSYSLKIKHSIIPILFDRTLNRTLEMDCDYIYNENDLLLVVRWFFHATSDRPEPFYQWIPEKKFRYVAEDYKQFFDMNYIAENSDPYTKYRSVVLKNPSPNMSGKYTCKVSSLANTDTREGSVFIYGKFFFAIYLISSHTHTLLISEKILINFVLQGYN